MPIIKSISSLRNKTRDIASLSHEQDKPVYLTTNGEGDLVVMSIEHYAKLKARVELFEKLAVAQAQASKITFLSSESVGLNSEKTTELFALPPYMPQSSHNSLQFHLFS